jgi:hypothetical protein
MLRWVSDSDASFLLPIGLPTSPGPSDRRWPVGNSSQESNQSLRIIPLFLVRDGSNMTLDTDFCGFGLGYRHMHLRTASFRRLTPEPSCKGIS